MGILGQIAVEGAANDILGGIRRIRERSATLLERNPVAAVLVDEIEQYVEEIRAQAAAGWY